MSLIERIRDMEIGTRVEENGTDFCGTILEIEPRNQCAYVDWDELPRGWMPLRLLHVKRAKTKIEGRFKLLQSLKRRFSLSPVE